MIQDKNFAPYLNQEDESEIEETPGEESDLGSDEEMPESEGNEDEEDEDEDEEDESEGDENEL